MSTRDEARAEVARLLEYDEQYTHDSDGTKWFDYESGADRILADFDRIAGLLGYVKADSEEWAVEGDKPEPWVMDDHGIKSREEAEAAASRVRTDWPAVDPTARVVRRLVGPWEVA